MRVLYQPGKGNGYLVAGVLLAAWMRWRGVPWPSRRQWLHALVSEMLAGGAVLMELSLFNGDALPQHIEPSAPWARAYVVVFDSLLLVGRAKTR